MKLSCRRALVTLGLLLSANLLAQTSDHSPETQSPRELVIAAYPEARVLRQSSAPVADYQLARAPYRKVAGVWRSLDAVRVAGRLTRLTQELPAGHSYDMGFTFAQAQLADFATELIFECKGRDCGSSNSWANNHFKVLQLYGQDQAQRYGLYSVTLAGVSHYVVIYAVQRGNNRVYLQVEHLVASDAPQANP